MKMTKEQAMEEYHRLISLQLSIFKEYCKEYKRVNTKSKPVWEEWRGAYLILLESDKIGFRANKIRVKYFIVCLKRYFEFEVGGRWPRRITLNWPIEQ